MQRPTFSQSWNRYCYVLNSPLSLVDPSGYTYDFKDVNFLGPLVFFAKDEIEELRRLNHLEPGGVIDIHGGADVGSSPSLSPSALDVANSGGSVADNNVAIDARIVNPFSNRIPGNSYSVAWASKAGFLVHQRMTWIVLGDDITRAERRILDSAQVYADSDEFQSTESSFRHAMRTPGQSVEEARHLANNFIRQQFLKAWNAKTRDKALFEFGVALHTLQDSTSPAHAGFQVWKGMENTTQLEMINHGRKELFYNSHNKDAALYRATEAAWLWFQNRSLPDGNLLIFGHD